MKQFECKWGAWDEEAMNWYEPKTEVVNESFFGELPEEESIMGNSRGYEYTDLVAIANLLPGESWECSYGNHTVTRIDLRV